MPEYVYQFEYVRDAGKLERIAAEVRAAHVVALDLETVGFDPWNGRIRLLSLNTGRGIYVIDLFATGGLGPLRDVLNNPDELTGEGHPVIVGQNLKFDQKWLLHHHKVSLWPVFDTFRASALIYNGRKQLRHDLYSLYERELHISPKVSDQGGSDWTRPILSPEQLDYAAEDVHYLPHLRDRLRAQLLHNGLRAIAELEFAAIEPEAAVELNGFYLDREKWLSLFEWNKEQRDTRAKALIEKLPMPTGQICLPGMQHWNLESQPQMLASLRKIPGLHILAGTSEGVLVAEKETHPIVGDVIDWRMYATRCKMFGEEYLEYVNPRTGRIHPDYFAMLVTGRYAARNPNLGQIPRDIPDVRSFRECFTSPPGKKRVLADFSGIELRLIAQLTKDPLLSSSFAAGGNPHRLTASIVMQKLEKLITKEERQAAKPVNFGFCYGMQPEKFVAYALKEYEKKFTLEQAVQFRERYFAAYKGIARWHEVALERGHASRRATTKLGRYRLMSAEEHNEYLNHPIQGDGADGLKLSLREVYRRTRNKSWIQMVHHVHDEILLDVDAETKDDPNCKEAEHLLVEGMKAGMGRVLTEVSVDVESGIGDSWAAK